MNWHQLAYFVFIVIAAMVMGLLAWYARRRREVPGSDQYMWTVLLVSLMSVFDGLSMTAQSKEWALFWFQCAFPLFGVLYPVAWLIFAILLHRENASAVRGQNSDIADNPGIDTGIHLDQRSSRVMGRKRGHVP